jgi:long-chain acyl-CoA synthetase
MDAVTNYQNIRDMLRVTFEKYPDKAGYRWIMNASGDTGSVTWKQFHEEAVRVSRALMKLGIRKGDRVGIAGFCSYHWVLGDIASVFIGGVTVGIYHSLLPDDCAYLLRHSGAKAVFAEDPGQLEKLIAVRKKIPGVKKAILLNGTYAGKEKGWVIGFDEFLKSGEKVTGADFEKRAGQVKPSDLASIVYTSGTSGIPKGAMITHDNIIFTAQTVKNFMPIVETDETFLFLPLPHIFARVDVYATIIANITVTFCRSIETVIDDLKIARPHWFPSVPRVFEKVYLRIHEGVSKKGGLALVLFSWAMKTGYRVSDLKLEKKAIPPFLALNYALASKLIFKKIHDALGGRIRFCVSGAAPLNPTVARFFHAAGIIILEGYGMTENTSFTNAGKIDNFKFGSVGLPAPGVEQKIHDDGEILYRGRNVMKGYYKMPGETKKSLGAGGWLHTGDTGHVDRDGFLVITGRKKELIITSGGKNIAPARIESILQTSRYINQVCVLGDGRNYISALVTLNAEAVDEYAKSQNIAFRDFSELLDHPEIKRLVEKEIQGANEKLASFESIKRFRILPEFTIADGLLTPTFKLKKNEIGKRYAREIDSLYSGS